jgi:acetyl esterase/lipase
LFFFGGGWAGGTPEQFYPQCIHLAQKGVVAFSAEYRVKNKHDTTPFECVKDGKSAVRWIRTHAQDFRVDPDRIIASGGSAGGHVAACTALIHGFDEESTDVSSIPDVLVLYNPVIDTSKQGFGYRTLKDRYREISPLEHVRKDLPPTIIFQGAADTTTPPAGHREFQRRMLEAGNRCRLELFEGEKHGFFNPGRGKGYDTTTQMLDQFLAEIRFLPGTTKVNHK